MTSGNEIPFIPSMRPEPARDDRGHYILPDPVDGLSRSWARATTIAHTLDDDFHLTQWKRRMVLQGAATQPDLLTSVPDLTAALAEAGDDWRTARDIKRELDALCDAAAGAAGANDGSKLGTLLHTITEYDDAGRIQEIDHLIPEALIPDLKAYRRAMDTAGIERPAEWIERITVCSAVEAAGTFDRLLLMPRPCVTCGKKLRIGDLKTQKTVDFGFLSIAIQLSEYANADAMLDDESGQLIPMPDDLCRCSGVVMHLPVGKATCVLYEIDLIAGWDAALAAHTVREFRSRSKALGRVYTPRSAPAGDQLTYLIRSAGHPDALTALWRDQRAVWTDEHTKAAAARKAQLIGSTH